MEEGYMRLIYVLTDLVAPLVVGYYLHRCHIVSEESMNKLIRFNVVCVYTVLSLLSFWVLPLNWQVAIVPLYGFLFILFPGALGLFCGRRFHNLLNRGAYMSSAMLANIGTLGGVCTFILYNEEGFAYAQIIGTCQNVMLVLAVFPMAQYYYQKHTFGGAKTRRTFSFREMFLTKNQISLLGMAAGLALNAGSVARPEFLAPIFQSFVHIGAWIAMLPVGFLINFRRAKPYILKTWDIAAFRFLAVPLFIGLTSHLLFSNPVLLGSCLVLAATPTAINAVITSQLYKLNVNLAIASFLLTTILFLLVVFPILFFILH